MDLEREREREREKGGWRGSVHLFCLSSSLGMTGSIYTRCHGVFYFQWRLNLENLVGLACLIDEKMNSTELAVALPVQP
jgi:hypothetical protein